MSTRSRNRLMTNLALLALLVVSPRFPPIHSLWWLILDTVYSTIGHDVDIHLNTAAVWLLRIIGGIFLFNALLEFGSLYSYPSSAPLTNAPTGPTATVPLSGQNQLNRFNPAIKSNPDTRSIPSPVRSPLRSRPFGPSAGTGSTPQRWSALAQSGIKQAQQTPPSNTAAPPPAANTSFSFSTLEQPLTPLQQAIAKAAQSAAVEDASMSQDWVPPNNSFDVSTDLPPAAPSSNRNLFGPRTSASWNAPPTSGNVLPPWSMSASGNQNPNTSDLGLGAAPQSVLRSGNERRVPSAAEGDISWAEDGADKRIIDKLRSQWAADDAAEASTATTSTRSRLAGRSGSIFHPPTRQFSTGLALGH